MEKINRKTALQRGLKRFFTGEPCKNGHVSVRFLAKSGKSQCLECHRLTQMRYWQKQGPEQARERSRLAKQRQRERDPERVRQQWREWYARQKAKEEVQENSHSR